MSKTGKPGKSAPPTAAPDNIAGFEAALAELESLVDKMESGDLSLEESLQQFERGVGLVRGCQESLRKAELKIKELGKNIGDDAVPTDLAGENDQVPF